MKYVNGVILVQSMSNMSSRRHDLDFTFRHTDILQPHQERLEKSFFSDSFKKCCFLLHKIYYSIKMSWAKPFKVKGTIEEEAITIVNIIFYTDSMSLIWQLDLRN